MPVSLGRILVVTDFSQSANRALKYADVIAEMFCADLHVLHVVVEPLPLPGPNGAWIRPEDALPAMVTQAEQDLAENVRQAQLHCGSPPICAIRVGFPLEQILKYAEDNDIDVIVVGTHGHRGLSRLLLGSVAEKLVRMARCPVMTVHAEQ
ncbi:MAG: universal stress protein [Planctomycetes bacterium]|nr:universal stress protein [Planctomycetota bacterium]